MVTERRPDKRTSHPLHRTRLILMLPMRPKPDIQELESSRDVRIALGRLEHQEQYLSLLRRAARLRLEAGQPENPALAKLITDGNGHLMNLKTKAIGKIVSRKRPKMAGSRATGSCLVFLDECGAHFLESKDPFPVFCLAATIVPEEDYSDLDLQVRAWKAKHLGSADAVIHEPEIRGRLGPWSDPARRKIILPALEQLLAELAFTVVAVVLRRSDYVARYGLTAPDESLPSHPYLMSLDFLFERIVMALEGHFGGARAKVIAESRGPKEDALLQHEFARLHLEGTAYIAPPWFRQALHPGIHFEGKGGVFGSGLQLSDLAARPIGEKVASPNKTPWRWAEIRSKLCVGSETKHSILGLKILPWEEAFDQVWKS